MGKEQDCCIRLDFTSLLHLYGSAEGWTNIPICPDCREKIKSLLADYGNAVDKFGGTLCKKLAEKNNLVRCDDSPSLRLVQ